MANKKGFNAVSLEALSDAQLEASVLSNWHKLNAALKAGQPLPVLRNLLVLELSKGSSARPVIAERLRASISRAISQQSARSLVEVMKALSYQSSELIDEGSFISDCLNLGLDDKEAYDILYKLRESE